MARLFRPVTRPVRTCEAISLRDRVREGNCFRVFHDAHLLKEPLHRPPVDLRQPSHDHRAHAIVANFILAHLLIRDADRLGRPVLSNVGGDPCNAQTPSDLTINEVRFVFHSAPQKKQSGATAAPPLLHETTMVICRCMVHWIGNSQLKRPWTESTCARLLPKLTGRPLPPESSTNEIVLDGNSWWR